jgi:hypothetical protein
MYMLLSGLCDGCDAMQPRYAAHAVKSSTLTRVWCVVCPPGVRALCVAGMSNCSCRLRITDPPLRKVVQGNNILMSGSDAMNTRVLFPVHGNVHAIEALTDACFLDILAPPYARMQRIS